MADAWAILASLDRFIEGFSNDFKLGNSHRVAPQDGPVVTANPLTGRPLTTLTILATQNKGPSPKPMTNDVAHPHLPPKTPGRVSCVKSHLWVVTMVRVVSSVKINHLPVAAEKMPVATVVSPFQINRLRATGRGPTIKADPSFPRLPMLPGWTRQSGATYMRSAPRIGSLMGAIRASKRNCLPGGKSNGAGISHTASRSRPRDVRDAVNSLERTRLST
jgi:hypothetical protein